MSQDIAISKLKISEQNVRKDVGDVSELAASIKEKGILQPPIVRLENSHYGVVMGSRRFAAAKEAKLKTIPCMVKEMDDDEAISISLVENLQRQDLEPKETAEGIAELAKTHKQTQIAKMVGFSNQWVTNYLHVFNLVEKIDNFIKVEKMPEESDRKAGRTIPLNHAIHFANALESPKIKKENIKNETLGQIAKTISPFTQTQTQKSLTYFREHPKQVAENPNVLKFVAGYREDDDENHGFLTGQLHEEPTEGKDPQLIYEDILRASENLWRELALTSTPAYGDDVLIEYIKPTRNHRLRLIKGIAEEDLAQLHNTLVWIGMIVKDTLDLIDNKK